MSRHKLKARDKITQKMSRDGLVERNETTNEDIRVSRREADFDIRGDTPKQKALSQVGTRSNDKTNSRKKSAHRQSEAIRTETSETHSGVKTDVPIKNDTPVIPKQETAANAEHNQFAAPQGEKQAVTAHTETRQNGGAPITPPRKPAVAPDTSRDPPMQQDGNTKLKTQSDTALHHNHSETPSERPKPIKSDSTLKFNHEKTTDGVPRDNELNLRSGKPESEALSQVGTRSKNKRKQKKKGAYRHDKSAVLQHEPQKTAQITDTADVPNETRKHNNIPVTDGEKNPNAVENGDINLVRRKRDYNLRGGKPESVNLSKAGKKPNAKKKHQKKGAYRHNKTSVIQHEPQKVESPLTHKQETAVIPESSKTEQFRDYSETPPQQPLDNPIIQHSSNANFKILRDTALRHTPEQKSDLPTAERKDGKPPFKQNQEQVEQPGEAEAVSKKENTDKQIDNPDNDSPRDTELNDVESETPESSDTPDTPLKHEKSGKLKFNDEETAPKKPDDKQSRKLVKAEHQSERTAEKLEKAKNKLPAKKKLRSERVFDEKKGKAKRRLYFEKEVKTQGQHLKGALPLRPVKAAGNTLMLNAHRKIYQVEHENVGIKAAHRAEMAVEGGVRAVLRHHKTVPYRKVAKLEKQAAKKTIKLNYQKVLADNPKLSSNMLSRMWQKRKIKKDYAKAARDAKKAAKAAKKAGSVTSEAAKLLAGVVRRHPVATAIVVLLALLLFMFMSLFGLGSGIGSSGLSGILAGSYLAEDESIENAELFYSEWETDLQFQILNAESDYPGNDEYRYNVGDISHNPYELLAYLTAVYQNFTYDSISSDLQALFNEQYSLTFTPSVEIRYADPTDANGDGNYEPYEWHVMTVTLTARSFNDVISSKMTAEQQAHYVLLMQTKGGRQYAGNPFDVGWLPYVTSNYGWRVHPITGAKDLHRGIDIALSAGTEIRSTQGGTVTFAGVSGGYGNVVIIENTNGITTKYAHCDTISVSVGQTVSKGDVIATVGNTGDSTGAHLHYELLKDGEYLNPAFFTDTGNFSLMPIYGTPGSAMGDGSFAALLAEAEIFLNYPYVWGGSSPSTSFDCSGYISYILRSSGVKDVGRQTAQGLYNLSTPIQQTAAQPGDLVFFHSTYSSANPITHVGLYVGVIDGHPTMIHAGSPISYARLDTAYWQSHLYSFARLN